MEPNALSPLKKAWLTLCVLSLALIGAVGYFMTRVLPEQKFGYGNPVAQPFVMVAATSTGSATTTQFGGDISFSTPARGIVLRNASGTCMRVGLTIDGTLSTATTTCQ